MQTSETNGNRISVTSRVMLFFTAALLTASLFFPIWRIELDAPQYPEGLCLKINANGLGGNVDIINGLNHYIGMKTLHDEDFVEFTVLPYLIVFFALASLITLLIGRKRGVYALLIAFVVFGIIAMIDFWKWEYNYGHNLDPNAAIIVPGMAYQPPLIGFKQLLNFGAYSIPDTGGWMFITAGLLMLFAALKEGLFVGLFRKKRAAMVVTSLFIVGLSSCGGKSPETIRLNSDNCEYCKMTIANSKFATEFVSDKGRVYKFDDLACMLNYRKENAQLKSGTCYVSDFLFSNKLIRADSLFYIRGDNVASPMRGNIAAFSNADSATSYSGKLNALPISWNKLCQ